MATWWNSLTLFEHILACIAIPATLVLLIQTALSLFGLGGGHDLDGDHDLDHDFDHDLDHDFDHDLDHDFDHDLDHDTDHDTDHDHDHDADHGESGHHGLSLHLFSLRSVIAFLAVFGWGSLAVSRAGHPMIAALIVGLVLGNLAMLAVSFVMAWFVSMQSNGAIDLRNAVGLPGTVYLPIPAARSGQGKVNVLLQERFVECDAVSDEETPISTGESVIVVGVTNEQQLVVIRQ